jgi:hypothetical protein
MRLRSAVLGVVTVALLGVGVQLTAEDRLRIEVSPRFSAAPGAVKVRATVARDDDNRALLVVADGSNYYRSSSVHLDGAKAAAITELTLKNLPAGRYEVRVVLTDAAGRETVERTAEVVVTGSY